MEVDELAEEFWFKSSSLLKAKVWDIVADWAKGARERLSLNKSYLAVTDKDLISEIPAVICGLAKTLENRRHLKDFDNGGCVFEAVSILADSRRQNGYKLESVLHDYLSLQQQLYDIFLQANLKPDQIIQLQRRLAKAMDKIIQTTVQAYNQRMSSELVELGKRDKLTGLLSKQTFHVILTEEINRAQRYRRHLSLVCLDIDRFKDFNRYHGRFVGNNLLRQISAWISSLSRSSDRASRLESDEFALLMPETNAKRAKIAAERIRWQIKQDSYRKNHLATVSTGIADFPLTASNSKQLFELAEKALLKSKFQGGDTINIVES